MKEVKYERTVLERPRDEVSCVSVSSAGKVVKFGRYVEAVRVLEMTEQKSESTVLEYCTDFVKFISVSEEESLMLSVYDKIFQIEDEE